jgi:signal transduction histidine kinase
VAGDDGRPKVALVHDSQLDDDPELVQVAGEVALLAAENAELDAASSDALDALRRSRARIVRAADDARRRLERDLHDSVQQRMVAVMIELSAVSELADGEVRDRLRAVGESLETVLDELRDLSHGIYPPALGAGGLPAALAGIRVGGARLELSADGVGRYPAEVESAVYYCCSEAIQNAVKHGGAELQIRLALHEEDGALHFEVADDGGGFDPSRPHPGSGLQNMSDRVGALDGRLSVISAPGEGTVVVGSIPLSAASRPPARAPEPRRAAQAAAGGTAAPRARRGGAP